MNTNNAMKSILLPNGRLKEQPEMKEPNKDEYWGRHPVQFKHDLAAYNSALSKCRELEPEGWKPVPGILYEEGKDYEVQEYLTVNGIAFYAVPIASSPVLEQQEELVFTLKDMYACYDAATTLYDEDLVKEAFDKWLKDYLITRKQQ